MISAVLVYDIGTTSVKSALFDFSGDLLFSVSVPYPTRYAHPGWAEQDPGEYWQAVITGTQELQKDKRWNSLTIEAVSLTGHMNGTLCVDGDGEPVYPQLIHSDTRSALQVQNIIARVPQKEIYRESGNRMDEFLSLPKLLWIHDMEKQAFSDCQFVINSKDFVRSRLTGVVGTTDFSDASLTGAFSMERRGWNQELIEAVGLSVDIFPDIHPSFHVDGYITGEAARILGLPEGTPVAMGGGDAACATRGAMVNSADETYISLGSSSWMSMLRDSSVHDEMMRMQHFYDLDGNQVNVCGTTQAAGTATDWSRDILTHTSDTDLRVFEQALSALPIGNGLITLPFLQGERTPHWDAHARGSMIGLSSATTAHQMARSWYEAVAFALYSIYEVYLDLSMHPAKITLIGGGSRSDFWTQMIADVFGTEVNRHPFPLHATSYGAALAGMVAAGAYPTIGTAVSATTRSGTIVPPEERSHETYMHYYSLYGRLYDTLRPLYRDLSKIHL